MTYALGDVAPRRVTEPIALDKAAAPIALRVFASDVAGNTTEFVLPLNLPDPVAVRETPPEAGILRTWLYGSCWSEPSWPQAQCS